LDNEATLYIFHRDHGRHGEYNNSVIVLRSPVYYSSTLVKLSSNSKLTQVHH